MDTVLSILNFETGGKKGRAGLITSPRSLEACLRQGVDPKDLLPVPYEAYAHSDDFKRRLTPEEQTIKYEHMENRRKNKVRDSCMHVYTLNRVSSLKFDNLYAGHLRPLSHLVCM